MHTLYWIPKSGDPQPRFNAFDEQGRRYLVPPCKVKDHQGVLKFTFPENNKNNLRMANLKPPWFLELPEGDIQKETTETTVFQKESPKPEDSKKTPIDKQELMEILVNNGISFRKNQKAETLWEKLPDDIAGNFKLVESSSEVQT